jgi:hypothetical protein
MVRPGGPEDAYPMFNYNCNLNPPLESGLYSDSKNPMKFGQTKNKGEYQYYYNDYPPEPINLYPGAGGGVGDYTKPSRINNDLFIGSFFGKNKKQVKKIRIKPTKQVKKTTKPKKKTVKEGSVITIKRKKNGKSKIIVN